MGTPAQQRNLHATDALAAAGRVSEIPAHPLPAPDLYQRLLTAHLPSPPQVLLELLALCQCDDTGMAELAELVGRDPAITAKVMKVAHSAAFHPGDAPSLSLFQACSRLGTALIKVLIISECVLQTFGAFQRSTCADLQPFWHHSLRVAVTARELAKRLDAQVTELAYLSGLLHDVGRLALLTATNPGFAELFEATDDETLCVFEQGRLGISHVQAGTWLLQRWQLDPLVVQAISQHHDTLTPVHPASALPRILHTAHCLAGLSPDDTTALMQLADPCGISMDDLRTALQTADLQVGQIARDLGLDIGAAAPVKTKTDPHRTGVDLNPALQQSAQEVFDRSVFNTMAMTLMGKHTMHATLASMREHASALLHLDVSVVMLLRQSPQVLVVASQDERNASAASLNFALQTHAPLASCVETRSVVFTSSEDERVNALHHFMDAKELVLIPLVTAQKVLAVLMATVPDEHSRQLRSQIPMLKAFGVYAGLALARRHQADKLRHAQMTVTKQQSRVELLRISQEIRQWIEQGSARRQVPALTGLDLSACVRDGVQLLQDCELIAPHIQLRTEFADRATWVLGSSDMIKQMMHILLKNACEAMPNGGDVVVSVGALVQHQGSVYTLLSVTDNATSAARRALKAEIYEPVVAGAMDDARLQGLSIVNYLTEKMTGQFRVRTGDSNTRFEVLLPCARPAAAAAR